MRKIKNYENFINEGKISQFITRNVFNSIGYIKSIIKRVKGNYTPLEFKDKKMEKDFEIKLFELFDYAVFDTIKYAFSKKQKIDADKTSLSNLIKKRTGTDVYVLTDTILDMLKLENIKISENKEKETDELIKNTVDTVKKTISFIKKIDDEIIDDKKFMNELNELSELFKGLDPRTTHLRDKDDTLQAFDNVRDKLDEIEEPKELNDILDKIGKFGMSSLTEKEKKDLEILSR